MSMLTHAPDASPQNTDAARTDAIDQLKAVSKHTYFTRRRAAIAAATAAGLTQAEIADALGMSERTVLNDLKVAR